jgi:hypothetical protein
MRSKEYKFNIGVIVNNVKILKQIRMSNGKNKNGAIRYCKGYIVECCIDKYIWEITEYNLTKRGCPVCCNKIVIKDVNDIATTHPHLTKYFKNIEDAYSNTVSVTNEVWFKCPDCGFEKLRKIDGIGRYGYFCPKCSDGISTPNKFMFGILESYDMNFIPEYSPNWAKLKRYDFYIPKYNILIEMQGKQHYEESPRGRSLKEEEKNDRLKKELALANGFKEENYIVIDCRYSNLEDMKLNVINSNLKNIINFNNINWLEIYSYIMKSKVKIVCDYWDSKQYSLTSISKKLSISDTTVRTYLKLGTTFGWCEYNGELEQNKNIKNMIETIKKKVRCIELDKCFNSIKDASIFLKIHPTSISRNCRGELKSAGKDIYGNKLHWEFI